jgi:hypothetical protein
MESSTLSSPRAPSCWLWWLALGISRLYNSHLAVPLHRSCNRPRPLVMTIRITTLMTDTQLLEICRRTPPQIKYCSDHYLISLQGNFDTDTSLIHSCVWNKTSWIFCNWNERSISSYVYKGNNCKKGHGAKWLFCFHFIMSCRHFYNFFIANILLYFLFYFFHSFLSLIYY